MEWEGAPECMREHAKEFANKWNDAMKDAEKWGSENISHAPQVAEFVQDVVKDVSQKFKESMKDANEKLKAMAAKMAEDDDATNSTTTEDKTPRRAGHRARFVRDDTLPDGSVVESGKTFVKSWTIKNSGNAAWPEDTTLIHIGGDVELKPEASRVLIGAVPQGQEHQVNVKLSTAPDAEGRYWSYWRLVAGKQPHVHSFGLRLWTDLSVKKTMETSKDAVKQSSKDDEEWDELPEVPSMLGTTLTKQTVKKEEDDDDDDVVVPREVDESDDAPSAPPSIPSAWVNAVETLEEMGFEPSMFQELLKRHNGDVQKIVLDVVSTSSGRK